MSDMTRAVPPAFGFRWSQLIALAIGIHVPLALLRAQGCADDGVVARLRAAVGAPMSETLYVTRDYLPRTFPGVTFYRTERATRPIDGLGRRAAVVVAGRDTVLVVRVEDLGSLWSNLQLKRLPESWSFSGLFLNMLVQTGLVAPGPRVLRAMGDLQSDYRAFLSDQRSLARIKPLFEREDSAGVETGFFLATSAGVVYYHASLAEDGRLTATAELVSQYQRN